ncbi:MAG: hypothetical protein ACYTGB_14390 [Planctomycetota bacterium]|jgi:hypothetical protein
MKSISVAEAKPGMVLAKPITDRKGRAIVSAGTQLTQLYISRLEKWGVEKLDIEEPGDKPATAGAGGASRSRKGRPGPSGDGALPRPPGVYGGADLADRITSTFARVASEPLMIALRDAAVRRLTAGAGDKE